MQVRSSEAGTGLAEVLVSLAIVLLATSSIMVLLVQNARINKSEKMASEIQASARNCLEMVVAKLRSGGWDPANAGIATVALDPDLSDSVSQIEVFADLDGDGATTGAGEQVLIRHNGDRVEWRPDAGVSTPFVILAAYITNDADGDGTPEPMFQPNSTTQPSRVTVQITAEAPIPDPTTGQPRRYTLTSDVILRKSL